MSGYVSRMSGFATQRTVARTDLLGGVFGVLVPSFFLLTGRRVPEDVANLVALWASATVLAVVALRLFAAPYYVWREDQSEISRLQTLLEEPRRKGREALMNSFQEDRVALIKKLMTILGDLREQNDANKNALDTIKMLYRHAGPFLIDSSFKVYWHSFERHLHNYRAVQVYSITPEAQEFDMVVKIGVRYAYHVQMIEAAVAAMTSWLGYDEKHEERFKIMVAEVDKNTSDVDLSFASPNISWITRDE